MLLKFHRIRRSEKGQALVLGAVTVLLLAFAVMMTINIGDAVYEKIKLQNNADSVAYSTAAVEARALNFIAYLNRAQVVHYVSMMTLISYLSYAYYIKVVVGAISTILSIIFPPLAGILAQINQILGTIVQVLDYAIVILVPLLNALNGALYLLQDAMVTTSLSYILHPDVLQDNDQRHSVMRGFGAILLNIANAYSYMSAFDLSNITDLNPFNSKITEARVLMHEIANSARLPWVYNGSPDVILIGRRWHITVSFVGYLFGCFCAFDPTGPLRFAKTARTEMGYFDENDNENRHDQIFAIDEFGLYCKVTRFHWGVPVGCQWITLIAFGAEAMADWSGGGHGYHISGIISGGISDSHNVHYYAGVTPYVRYKPLPQGNKNFNQPDVLILNSISESDLNQPFKVWNIDTTLSIGQKQGSLNTKINNTANISQVLPDGFNVLSAAQVYYHRPGDWKEHPNLFNPLWSARLMPISEVKDLSYLPSQVTQFLSDYLLIH